MSKFKSRKYVFKGNKRVNDHGIVQKIKFKHMVKYVHHTETFQSRMKSLALLSLFGAARDVQCDFAVSLYTISNIGNRRFTIDKRPGPGTNNRNQSLQA